MVEIKSTRASVPKNPERRKLEITNTSDDALYIRFVPEGGLAVEGVKDDQTFTVTVVEGFDDDAAAARALGYYAKLKDRILRAGQVPRDLLYPPET